MHTWILSCSLILFITTNAHAMESAESNQPDPEPEASWFQISTTAELGFTAPLSHKIQQG